MIIMEAAALQKKKNSKTKLKKTIKNVLCRPDPVFWPTISDDQGKVLIATLNKYKISMPEFKKPHWKDLRLIPKEKRPKPPKTVKVVGLIFGITECSLAIQNGACSAIIIESTVNPRTIAQPVLEACISARVPAVSLKGLRKNCTLNFGIPTSCLAIKKGFLPDICEKIVEFAKNKLPQNKPLAPKHEVEDSEMLEDTDINESAMEVQQTIPSVYLFRTSKKNRVFTPPSESKLCKSSKEFIGQSFIELSDKPDEQMHKRKFMHMIVKKISNNANRTKD